jgi:DNA-binding XRE family transcriptional regulator
MDYAEKCRMACGKLDLSIKDFAQYCNLSEKSYGLIHKGRIDPTQKSKEKINRFIESTGLEFVENGVIENKDDPCFEGQLGIRLFFDDVYNTCKETGGNISLYNGSPSLLIKWLGEEWYKKHAIRMGTIADTIDFNILIEEGDYNFIAGGFAKYRWCPKEYFRNRTVYIYGNKYAFLKFYDDNVVIEVSTGKETADVLRDMFQIAWDHVSLEIGEQ